MNKHGEKKEIHIWFPGLLQGMPSLDILTDVTGIEVEFLGFKTGWIKRPTISEGKQGVKHVGI